MSHTENLGECVSDLDLASLLGKEILNHCRALRGVISSVSSVWVLLVLVVVMLSSSVLRRPRWRLSALPRQNFKAATTKKR